MALPGLSRSAAHLAPMSSSSGLCRSRCSMTPAMQTSGPRVSNSRETSSRAFSVMRGRKLIEGYSVGAGQYPAENSAKSIQANLTIRYLPKCRSSENARRARAVQVREFYCTQIDGYQCDHGSDVYSALRQRNRNSYGETAMRSDFNLKRDVEDELRSDPDIDSTDIAVAVKDGVVTLTGFVRSFRQKRKAEEDVKHVAGVVGVANNIEVRLPIIHRRPDPDIARDAVEALKRDLPFSWDKLKVTVEDGWITLEGEVEWQYQRE